MESEFCIFSATTLTLWVRLYFLILFALQTYGSQLTLSLLLFMPLSALSLPSQDGAFFMDFVRSPRTAPSFTPQVSY